MFNKKINQNNKSLQYWFWCTTKTRFCYASKLDTQGKQKTHFGCTSNPYT